MTIDAGVRRVALLARPGVARDRLSTVLDEAGAMCVLAADPTKLDPTELIELAPQLVVVALDPFTEEVLEQFDAVLGDPTVDVIYEEADQAASREGWDAARWQRHLVAKLQGHGNVLPPDREPPAMLFDAASSFDRVPEPVESGDPDFDALSPADVADPLLPATAGMFDPVNAEVEGFDADAGSALSRESRLQIAEDTPASASGQLLSLESLEPEIPGYGEPASEHASAPVVLQQEAILTDFDFSFELAGADPSADGVGADALDDGGFALFDPVNQETTAPVAISPHIDFALALDGDGGDDEVKDQAVEPRQELSLQHDDPDIVRGSRADSLRPDLSGLHERISMLELVDDAPGEIPARTRERGAVLILSGLGGPDAVRQLLGALPQGFTRPVLVRQHLDGGRYDRLVTQLQRATALPVELAEPAQVAMPGTVYILPDAVGAASDEDGIRFCGNPDQTVLAALPSADSAVLLLSGSDPAHVEAVMAHADRGALVAGQAADGCYDPAASNALAERGGDVASPVALALRLSARWSNQGSSNVQA